MNRDVNGTKPKARVTRTALGDIGNVTKQSVNIFNFLLLYSY